MPRNIRASELRKGDVLKGELNRGPISVKDVQVRHNPVSGEEVVVKGPLGFLEKYHPSKIVTILNNR